MPFSFISDVGQIPKQFQFYRIKDGDVLRRHNVSSYDSLFGRRQHHDLVDSRDAEGNAVCDFILFDKTLSALAPT